MSPFARRLLPLWILALLSTPFFAEAQQNDAFSRVREDTTVVRMLSLRSGSIYHGRIVELTDEVAIVRTKEGTLTIRRADVARVTEVTAPRGEEGGYWFPNPNSTRLLFSPTGRMLPKSEGYFSDYMLFFPGVALGVTDEVTLGGGMSLFPGAESQLFYFTPKVGLYQSAKTNLAIGALYGTMMDADGGAGIAYGVGTFGSPDASLTAGLGWGFSGTEFSNRPIALLGGDFRLSRRVSFVTENWLIPETDPLVSFGLRFMGERMSVDLAMVRPMGEGVGLGLPWVDFVINF